ncbi:MAG: hypothetical protein CML13_15980 [Puniceicoccaceae bacterium]|nr:hypothetical protein [Puniceicoccaceae bacterium]|tara:strand:+ start:13627 stop:14100 length:474 start_codon:yes stop_codon:yes gene_type:complete
MSEYQQNLVLSDASFWSDCAASLAREYQNNPALDDQLSAKLILIQVDRRLGFLGIKKFRYAANATRFKILAQAAPNLSNFFKNPNQWNHWISKPNSLSGLAVGDLVRAVSSSAIAGGNAYFGRLRVVVWGFMAAALLYFAAQFVKPMMSFIPKSKHG